MCYFRSRSWVTLNFAKSNFSAVVIVVVVVFVADSRSEWS